MSKTFDIFFFWSCALTLNFWPDNTGHEAKLFREEKDLKKKDNIDNVKASS